VAHEFVTTVACLPEWIVVPSTSFAYRPNARRRHATLLGGPGDDCLVLDVVDVELTMGAAPFQRYQFSNKAVDR
jgi:hypothetical protein